jgi:hypothetical protein
LRAKAGKRLWFHGDRFGLINGIGIDRWMAARPSTLMSLRVILNRMSST